MPQVASGPPVDTSAPGDSGSLASTLERLVPISDDLMAEVVQLFAICRHSVIIEMPGYYRPQPATHVFDGHVHSSLQFCFHFFQLRMHPLLDGLS